MVASDRVEVLLFPRILFARYGQSKLLERMREELDTALPSTEEAFRRFTRDERWKAYKKQVVDEVICKPSSNHAKLSDVPLVYRQGAWRSVNVHSPWGAAPAAANAGNSRSSTPMSQ